MNRELKAQLAHLMERRDDAECRRQMAALLEQHPELMDAYIEQSRVDSLLEWALAPAPTTKPLAPRVTDEHRTRSLSPRWGQRITKLAGALVAIAAVIAVVAAYNIEYAPVGKVIALQEVAWVDGGPRPQVGETFRRGILESTAGSCVLEFESGVELFCDGAFRLRVVDDMLVELEHGKLRAKVPHNARGFSVDTPDTLLVDQGTVFGVNAEAGDGTKVVVFEGEVDVYFKDVIENKSMRRLSQGEGAQLVAGRGSLDRVPQVTSGTPASKWSAGVHGEALLSIRDNIRAADSLKYYNIVVGGLHEDVPAWVDRAHEWNGITADGIPKIVRGADYAMTFNDDRYNREFKMFVTIHRPANLYVFIDNRIANLPDWLVEGFEDTGEELGLDEGWYVLHQMEAARGAGQSIDQTFSIWRRRVPEPTELELGGFDAPAHFGMYGLAATPLE